VCSIICICKTDRANCHTLRLSVLKFCSSMGSWIFSCRTVAARCTGHGWSGQSLCSKDVTTHQPRPGARPDRPILHHLLCQVVGGVDILLDVISGVESTMMMMPFNCSCRNNNLKHGSNYLYCVNKRPFFGNCVITLYGVITSHVFSKCVAGCRWSGYPVKRDWWGGKRNDDDAF